MIYRVKKNYQFSFIYRKGRSFANGLLVMYVVRNKNNVRNAETFSKIGVSVSKKVGNSVVRSRSKRLINESFRLNYNNISKGYDFVFIARNSIKMKKYSDVEKAMISLLKKAGLYKNEENIIESN
ncbi:ribonuclease P protein component [Clostridium sp. BJN0001]|uniref:ribonuclease P protein component n=1 Tax=Clostridium sp. BJN0001 TaxID=2930219 RepID=UPI001FCFCCF9|nr:ribonuclease P protein component [Clostridium sp. BJN0001]